MGEQSVTLSILLDDLNNARRDLCREDHLAEPGVRVRGSYETRKLPSRSRDRNCTRKAGWRLNSPRLVEERTKILCELGVALLRTVSGDLKRDGPESLLISRGVASQERLQLLCSRHGSSVRWEGTLFSIDSRHLAPDAFDRPPDTWPRAISPPPKTL